MKRLPKGGYQRSAKYEATFKDVQYFNKILFLKIDHTFDKNHR